MSISKPQSLVSFCSNLCIRHVSLFPSLLRTIVKHPWRLLCIHTTMSPGHQSGTRFDRFHFLCCLPGAVLTSLCCGCVFCGSDGLLSGWLQRQHQLHDPSFYQRASSVSPAHARLLLPCILSLLLSFLFSDDVVIYGPRNSRVSLSAGALFTRHLAVSARGWQLTIKCKTTTV